MEINKIDWTLKQFQESNFERFEYKLFQKKRIFPKLTFISGLVPDLIQLLFGKCNFKIKGEFNNSIWILEFEEQLFAMVSAKGRGTTLETIGFDEKICSNFVDLLVSKFLALDHPRIQELKIFLT